MKATIEDGELVVRIFLEPEPTPSSTGKTLLVATSRGPQVTEARVNNKAITVTVNAYIKP